MADESYTFTAARTRLEEIVAQVRKKDVSLEKSLDLLEEGVRLANVCTELSDHTEWRSVVQDQDEASQDSLAAESAASVELEPAEGESGESGSEGGDGADGSERAEVHSDTGAPESDDSDRASEPQ